jgi:hypothetical protein
MASLPKAEAPGFGSRSHPELAIMGIVIERHTLLDDLLRLTLCLLSCISSVLLWYPCDPALRGGQDIRILPEQSLLPGAIAVCSEVAKMIEV